MSRKNANDTDVRWRALDAEGNKSDIAKVSLSGILTPSAEGTVYVQASLRSNPEVSDTLEITVLPEETEQPADKTQLSALISQAEALEAEDYTAESYGVLQAGAGSGRGCHGGSGSL